MLSSGSGTAANASSVTLSADVGSWAHTCLQSHFQVENCAVIDTAWCLHSIQCPWNGKVCLSQHGATAANPLLQVCYCSHGGREILIITAAAAVGECGQYHVVSVHCLNSRTFAAFQRLQTCTSLWFFCQFMYMSVICVCWSMFSVMGCGTRMAWRVHVYSRGRETLSSCRPRFEATGNCDKIFIVGHFVYRLRC